MAEVGGLNIVNKALKQNISHAYLQNREWDTHREYCSMFPLLHISSAVKLNISVSDQESHPLSLQEV